MTRPPTPRQGPRPLPLHLAAAVTMLTSCAAGLPILRSGSLWWKPPLRGRANALAEALDHAGRERFPAALERETRRQLDGMLAGILGYRHHPYHRTLSDPPVLWSEGSVRLLDYGPPGGVPALFVPSLVNRAYVLDLTEDRSLLRWLAGRGVRPLLLDWGRPGPVERRYSLDDYIAGVLDRALAAATGATGGAVSLVGYCMGGLLALAACQRRPDRVSRLVLMATPWDFHESDQNTARLLAAAMEPLLPWFDAWGEVPVDVLQALFAQLDPFLALRKFGRFARLDPASGSARAFVALEDWLNDGIPLAAPVARQVFAGWYGRNEPAAGVWTVGGQAVDPGRVPHPTLVLIPEHDRIVPPASALAVARFLPDGHILRPPLGHIGMVVSAGAKSSVWEPLASWLNYR